MIRIEVEGFSGPLDLLCHLIESRELEANSISVAQIIKVYGAYHSRKGEVSIEMIASFLVQAASLVLEKAIALTPKVFDEEVWEDGDLDQEELGPNLEDVLERYRPYRKAAAVLADLQIDWSKRSFRSPFPLPPRYDIGDLYSLSSLWWELMKGKKNKTDDLWGDDSFAAVPPPIPDEVQVDKRMETIIGQLEPDGVSLSFLLGENREVSSLVVTMLALLELSRKNMVFLEQKEMFGDVLVYPQNR
ncbi:segregation and condensation protein A [Dethiosulfovibrio salsuginis]|uniref:Segregation and condensation protein A n=1 Tax=Dethiosulfovibrio salsuginis TaxID=561720 RepID=A0A1X7IBF1_9BACT|nr:ScpA family protein [Dethiosulfovibrio salsuginis]SMG11525.1 condensin subunit ScpA [Dethiosulfovibrio salsuginis]